MNRVVMNQTDPPDRRRLLICLALAAAVLMIYGQTVTFDFTGHDDNYFVTENPVVQRGLSLPNLAWAMTAVQNGTWQPLTWLTHMLDCQLFGLWAGGHHLVNVLYHLANTLLLFLLLNRLTGTVWRSSLVAALFAIHPLHVESVAWIAERRDVLSTIWGLSTIWSYQLWVGNRRSWRYLLLLLCFAMSLMAKPMLVTLPVLLLLLDIWPLRRLEIVSWQNFSREKRRALELLVEKVPLLLMAAAMSVITMIAVEAEGSLGSIDQFPLVFRLENALGAYIRYLWLTFLPINLLPHYPYPASIPFWQSSGASFLLLSLTILSWRRLKSQPYLFFGWCWFLISMFPVIGLVQQGSGFIIADRYTYVPLIGIFVIFAWGGGDLIAEHGRLRRPVLWFAALLLAFYLALSLVQTSHWRNTETLFTYTLKRDPTNHVALQQLGVEFRERGDFQRAHEYLAEDLRLYPDNLDALVNFGQLQGLMGRSAEAVILFHKALRLQPGNPDLHLSLGQLRASRGELSEAETSLGQALRLQPDNLPARLNLGLVFYLQKKFVEAAAQFNEVLRTSPESADAYNGLGLIALEQGRWLEAQTHFRSALRYNPGHRHARENLRQASVKMD